MACVATAEMPMVRPSGAALATASAPMLPPPPGLVLDDHGAQAVLDALGQHARRDVDRPARRIGHDQRGSAVACAERARRARAPAAAASAMRRRVLRFMAIRLCNAVVSAPCLSASVVNESAWNSSGGSFGQRAVLGARRVHHDGRAAGIDLVAREVGKVLQHRLVHEAGAAGPVVLGQRVGDHRHVSSGSASRPAWPAPSRPGTGRPGGGRPSTAWRDG